MIRTLHFSADDKLHTDLNLIDLEIGLHDPQGVTWVDFQGASNEEAEPILRDRFHFHPLAIDDALQENHSPKLDDWGSYLYIVMHTILFDPVENEVKTIELDFFVGKNYLVTHHDAPVAAVDHIWQVCQRDERTMKEGPDHLLYRILDDIASDYMPVVEKLDLAIDDLEDEIFAGKDSGVLERLFSLKRSVLYLRRVLAPQREVLNRLGRDQYDQIDTRDRVYFRDVYDHLVRLYDIIESVRDLIGGTMETYLSVINNRMNEIMKTLTVITTLFMPLSFITGFFGMNFFQPSLALHVWTGLPALLATFAIVFLTPLVMFGWMRHRKWM